MFRVGLAGVSAPPTPCDELPLRTSLTILTLLFALTSASLAHAADCPSPSHGELLPLKQASVHFIDGGGRRSMSGMSLIASLYSAFQDADTVVLVEWAVSERDIKEIGTSTAWREISRVARDMNGSIVYVHIDQRAARQMPGSKGASLQATLLAWERSPPEDLAEVASTLCVHAPTHKFAHKLLDDHSGESGFHWHSRIDLDEAPVGAIVAHFDPGHSITARERNAWIERLVVAGIIIFLFAGVFAVSRRRRQRSFDWLRTTRGATCELCGCDILPGETICRACASRPREHLDEITVALGARRRALADALKNATWIDVSDVAKFFHDLAGTLEDRRFEAYRDRAVEIQELVDELLDLIEQIPGPDNHFVAPLTNRLTRFTQPERSNLDRWREHTIELYVCLDVVIMELQLRAAARPRT